MKFLIKTVSWLVILFALIPIAIFATGFIQGYCRYSGHSMGVTDWMALEVEQEHVRQERNYLQILRWNGLCYYVENFADKGWVHNLATFMESKRRVSLPVDERSEQSKRCVSESCDVTATNSTKLASIETNRLDGISWRTQMKEKGLRIYNWIRNRP